MNLNSLRVLLAAPFASLFLVLSLCAFVVQRPVSMGVHFPMTRVRAISFNDCYDDRDIVVRIKGDGSTWINETPIRPEMLGPTMKIIMQNRSERDTYVLTEPDVPYQRFVSAFDEISASASDLHVGVITPGLDRELQQCPPGSVCGLDWPDHGYKHSCLEFPILPVHVLTGPNP